MTTRPRCVISLDGATLGDPSRPRDQFATAVRADMGHRCCAGGAECAFIGADERGPFRLEARPAPFTLGSHLECHMRMLRATRPPAQE